MAAAPPPPPNNDNPWKGIPDLTQSSSSDSSDVPDMVEEWLRVTEEEKAGTVPGNPIATQVARGVLSTAQTNPMGRTYIGKKTIRRRRKQRAQVSPAEVHPQPQSLEQQDSTVSTTATIPDTVKNDENQKKNLDKEQK